MIEDVIIACLIADINSQYYIDELTEEYFSKHSNRIIFNIMKTLKTEGTNIDYITVSSKMPWNELSIKTLPTYDVSYQLTNIDDYISELKEQRNARVLSSALKIAQSKINAETSELIIEELKSSLNSLDIKNNKIIDLGDIDDTDYDNSDRCRSEIKTLDKMIGGFKMGELSVWTGKSGQGKSTLLSQIMLGAVNQGYKVCAYSGELVNEQFQHWLMLQACGTNNLIQLYDNIKCTDVYKPKKEAKEKIRTWLKGKFYLYNNEFTGKDNNIIDVFKLAYRKYGCTIFLVDNLMTAKYDYNNKDNYYIQQSGFVGELVRFAKTCNVHVHLIAHPKKTQGELSKEDIAGSLDITNRADNTFSVNRDEDINCTTVNILKNRSDGIQNKQVLLDFDIRSKRFTPRGDDMAKYKKYGWEI